MIKFYIEPKCGILVKVVCSEDIDTIIIPDKIVEIGDAAFMGLKNIKRVYISNKVQSIGAYAFKECTKLEYCMIPNGVKSIGEYAFEDCINLKIIVGNHFYYNDNIIISSGAFRNCKSLDNTSVNSIIAHMACLNIPDYMFAGCDGITDIIISNNIHEIQTNAFGDCKNLIQVTFPTNDNCIISNHAFFNTNIPINSMPNFVSCKLEDDYEIKYSEYDELII